MTHWKLRLWCFTLCLQDIWVAKQSPRKSHRFTSFEIALIIVWRAVTRGSTRREGWSCYLGSDRSHVTPDASCIYTDFHKPEKNTKKEAHKVFLSLLQPVGTILPSVSPSICQNTQHTLLKPCNPTPKAWSNKHSAPQKDRERGKSRQEGHIRIIQASPHIIRQYVLINWIVVLLVHAARLQHVSH